MTPANTWHSATAYQFAAALEMLENAINACPDALWGDRSRSPQFWYLVYHTLFFLDYYAAADPATFKPPAPFTLSEVDPSGVMPERVYTREEMRAFLGHGRARVGAWLASLDERRAAERCPFARRELSNAELALYSLRHVQHHSAQLNLILRQVVNDAPAWVSRGARPLGVAEP